MIKEIRIRVQVCITGSGCYIHPPYKNFVLEISIRGNEHRKDSDKDYANQDMNN